MKRKSISKSVITLATCISMVIPAMPASAADYEFRTGDDGKLYWYEFGVKQGTVDDTQGILGDGTNRGREIFDSASNGWYWLDSVYDGAKAVGKEVWIPYIYQEELIMSADGNGRMANGISDEAKIKELAQASITSEADMSAQVEDAIRNRTGKWVRYDENGVMLKGWVKIEGALEVCYPDQAGNVYYYDQKTGLMAKGNVVINGVQYHFNETTGVLDSGEMPNNTRNDSEGYYIFGSYEQDGNTSNGKEPIEWVILGENENGTLLVSRYILDSMKYNSEYTDVTWETCSLREWLNNEFYNTAFNDEEKGLIVKSTVTSQEYYGYVTLNSDIEYIYTYYGNDTEDNVFILSWNELASNYKFNEGGTENEYGGFCRDLIVEPTEYAISEGCILFEITSDEYYEYFPFFDSYTDIIGRSGAYWFIRNEGYDNSEVSLVNYYGMTGIGAMNYGGSYPVTINGVGIRPAIYIKHQ